jgi:acyl transferase domain-containing protein
VVEALFRAIVQLEGCAGLAGVIKVLLELEPQTMPSNVHSDELNPKITPYHGAGALVIPTRALPWPKHPRWLSGTNAHVVIESLLGNESNSHVTRRDAVSGVVEPLLLSASSGPALLRDVQANLAHLRGKEMGIQKTWYVEHARDVSRHAATPSKSVRSYGKQQF